MPGSESEHEYSTFSLRLHTSLHFGHTYSYILIVIIIVIIRHIAVLRNQVGLLDGDPDAPMGRGNFEKKGATHYKI